MSKIIHKRCTMSGQKITVEEYMQANNIKSRQTVYNRVQSGHLKSEKIDNRLYIILDNEIKESVQEDWTAEIIKNTRCKVSSFQPSLQYSFTLLPNSITSPLS